MQHYLKSGWKNVLFNKKTVLLIGLYQLLWTFIIYYLIRHTISPILRSLPDESVGSAALQLYWLEFKFLLVKTDTILPYLYIALALMLLRMLLTPFLQSGLFGTLSYARNEQEPNHFFSQLNTHWKSFTLLYWIKTLLVLTPVLVVGIPIIKQWAISYFTFDVLVANWLTILLLVVWIVCVRAISHSLLVGISNRQKWSVILTTVLKKAVILLTTFLLIAVLSLATQFIIQFTSSYMSSIIVTVLFFTLPIIQTFMKAWTIATHDIIFNQ